MASSLELYRSRLVSGFSEFYNPQEENLKDYSKRIFSNLSRRKSISFFPYNVEFEVGDFQGFSDFVSSVSFFSESFSGEVGFNIRGNDSSVYLDNFLFGETVYLDKDSNLTERIYKNVSTLPVQRILAEEESLDGSSAETLCFDKHFFSETGLTFGDFFYHHVGLPYGLPPNFPATFFDLGCESLKKGYSLRGKFSSFFVEGEIKGEDGERTCLLGVDLAEDRTSFTSSFDYSPKSPRRDCEEDILFGFQKAEEFFSRL
jgi:hypothetical protein